MLYERWLATTAPMPRWSLERAVILRDLPDLAGFDLACWCRLDQPCHADVLLRMANACADVPERPTT